MNRLGTCLFVVIGLLVACFSPLSAQSSNTYYAVDAADFCTNSLLLEDPSGLAAGDQVLLIQMKGATINEDNDGNFGDILDIGSAGAYELNTIRSVTGNTVQFERRLRYEYDFASLQLIKYLTVANQTISDTLLVPAWNGQTGGVLFLDITGTLQLEAPIIASGRGFRGGVMAPIASFCSGAPTIFGGTDFREAFFPAGNWRGAPKGEGVAAPIIGKEWGRGAQANGGGGGNDHNSGGAGGGNVTTGGEGGENNRVGLGCRGQRPGLVGRALPVLEDRIYLGGGGGSGHSNNNVSAGGNGGGIIIVRANTIDFTSPNAALIANGDSAIRVIGDGAGGGGAGGTIVMIAETVIGDPQISAIGGEGGVADNNGLETSMGPGGGGSGGHFVSNNFFPASLRGGENGRSVNSGTTSRPDSPNEAFAGENGLQTLINNLPTGTVSGGTGIETISSDTTVCGQEPLQLIVTIEGIPNLQWQFSADGSTFTDVPENANYTGTQSKVLMLQDEYAPGFYRLQVVETTACPPLFSDTIQVQTDARPEANFAFTTDGTIVTFTNTSQLATNYLWNFGNGLTSMAVDTLINFGSSGNFPVTLIAENPCGADTIVQEISIVSSGISPEAAFTTDVQEGCAPLIVTFTNQSTNFDSLYWEFPGGDPAFSTDSVVVVTYDAPGTYTPQIAAFGNGGADVLAEANLITVVQAPNVTFNAMVNGNEVSFDATIENVNTFVWSFGDGNGSTEPNPTHTYANGGGYTVVLAYTTDICGPGEVSQTITIGSARPPQAEISSSAVSGCEPLTIFFEDASGGDITGIQWQFENGAPASSTEEAPVVTFAQAGNHEVTLIASGPLGNDTTQMTVFVSAGPTAGFESAIEETTVTLQNTSTNGLTYQWNFGDGTTATDQNPTHSYAAAGQYLIQLISTNGCGSDTTEQLIEIAIPGPQAGFSFNPPSGCEPLTITFTNQSINFDSIRWAFPGGEPATATSETVSVVFPAAGTFSAALVAYGNGLTDTLLQENSIQVERLPDAAFSFSVDGNVVQFSNLATDAAQVRWEFGDGNTSNATNPIHTYLNDGVYTVLQVVGNGACGETETSQQVTIGAPLLARFGARSLGACAPLRMQFENQSSGAFDQVEWQFSGGEPATSTDPNPIVLFAEPGVHLVRLTVFGSTGITSDSSFIEITAPPNPNFEFSLEGFTAVFTDLSTGADRYSWNFGDGNSSTEANPVHVFPGPGVYEVTLNLQNGRCGRSTSRTIAIGVTSVEELAQYGIRFFPNPATDWLRVDGLEQATLTLYDPYGKHIVSNKAQRTSAELDVRRLPSGLYFLRIEDKRGRWLVQILKQ